MQFFATCLTWTPGNEASLVEEPDVESRVKARMVYAGELGLVLYPESACKRSTRKFHRGHRRLQSYLDEGSPLNAGSPEDDDGLA